MLKKRGFLPILLIERALRLVQSSFSSEYIVKAILGFACAVAVVMR